MTTQTGETVYYIDRYTDEVLPCEPTLENWAVWLSQPDPDFPHDIPKKGDTFVASVIKFASDIVASRTSAGWQFDHEPEGEPGFMAVRFGRGMGWSADNIVYPCTLDGLREFLEENGEDTDDVEYVAVGYTEPDVRLIYAENPPRLLIQGVVQ